MSFHLITSSYQDLLDQFKRSPLTDEVMEEIKDILFDYCYEIEQTYGIGMSFQAWIGEGGVGLKYEVKPNSELDAILMKHVVENGASVGPVSTSLQ